MKISKTCLVASLVASCLGLVTSLWAGSGQFPAKFSTLRIEIPNVVNRSFAVGHSDPSRILHISVSLVPRDPAGFKAYADSVSDPSSPYFHRFITPEEVGRRFGLTDTSVQSVVNHLTSAGLNVRLVGKNRLTILADGTVNQSERAFQTTINDYSAIFRDEPGNREFFSFARPLQVPTALARYVVDVHGLESFTRPQARALTANQTRTLYGIATSYASQFRGQGRATAISSFDGFDLSNLPLYYTKLGLPAPVGGVGSNVHVVTVSGGAASSSPQGEADLDIQMVLGVAPLSDLYIYDGGQSDLIGVLTQEVNDNVADVISESWGWNLSDTTAVAAHNLHLSMTAQGITYMAASGDSGTSIEPYSYPDYDSEVLSIGGTTATVSSSGTRTSEVGWNGSGGGWSINQAAFNVRPSWQTGTGVPTDVNYRMVPDISLHASSNTGAYQFYFNGLINSAFVGTSFASPVFCGSLAIAEQRIIAAGGLTADSAGKRRFGRIQDLIYSQNGRSDVWYDVKSGTNGTLPDAHISNATVGWDTVTGWGAINIEGFISSQIPAVIPDSPANLTAFPGIQQVGLLWLNATNAASYEIFRSQTSGGPYSLIGTTIQSSFADTGLVPGNLYYYVVRSLNKTGESGNSNEVSAIPSSPVELLLNGGFEGGRVSWIGNTTVINNLTASQVHTGTNAAMFCGKGIKGAYILYEQVTIPVNAAKVTLSYWVKVDTLEPGALVKDKFGVSFRSPANVVLKSAGSYSNLTPTAGYVYKSFDATALKGQTVRVYAYATEDATYATTFYLDDISLTVQ